MHRTSIINGLNHSIVLFIHSFRTFRSSCLSLVLLLLCIIYFSNKEWNLFFIQRKKMQSLQKLFLHSLCLCDSVDLMHAKMTVPIVSCVFHDHSYHLSVEQIIKQHFDCLFIWFLVVNRRNALAKVLQLGLFFCRFCLFSGRFGV